MSALKFTVQGLQQAAAAQERIRRGLAAQGEEVKKVTLSTAELGRISTKVSKDTESAQQRLIRKLDELKQAYVSGTVGVKDYEKAQQQLHNQFKLNTGEFSKFGDANQKAFGSSVVAGITRFAAQIGIIAKAQQVITKEMESQSELAGRAAAAAITVGQAQTAVGRNLPGRTRAEVRSVINAGTLLAAETGIQEQFIQNAVAQGISGIGGDNPVPLALSTVRSAAAFLSDRPDEIGEFTQTVAALGKVTGTQDPLVNQGLLTFLGAQSSITEPALQARNIGPSLIASVAAGKGNVSTQEAAGLFTAFSIALDERVGKITGTRNVGSINRVLGFDAGVGAAESGLDEAAAAAVSSTGDPGSGGFASAESIAGIRAAQNNLARRQGIAAALKGKSFSKRVNIIRQFGLGSEVGTEGLGEKAAAVQEEFLGFGPEVTGIFNTFTSQVAGIPDEAGLAASAQNSLNNLVVTQVQQAARRQRQIAAKAQRVDLKTGISGLSAEELENIANLRQQGGSATEIALSQFGSKLLGGGTLANQITAVEQQLNRGKGLAGIGLGERDQAEQDALVEVLKFLKGLQEESNAIQKEIRDELKSGEGGFKAGTE